MNILHEFLMDTNPDRPVALPAYEPPTEEQWELLMVAEGLRSLIVQYGAKQVMEYVTNPSTFQRRGVDTLIERYGYDRIVSYVRNLAAILGQEV